MKFTVLSETEIVGYPGACSKFPGVAKLANGDLLMLFCNSSASEALDQKMYIARSFDSARSWKVEGLMYDYSKLPFMQPFNDYCKPTTINNDELIAVGYGFLRDKDPELNVSAYAEKYGKFPTAYNYTSRSIDRGLTWSTPEFIKHNYVFLEFSGPALFCEKNKSLLAFGPPFTLDDSEQKGICFEKKENESEWKEKSIYFCSKNIAPWETRATITENGRIILIIWAFDLKTQQHLNNFIIWSDDSGRSWSKAFDTKLRGQAANWRNINGELYILYTRREGDKPGILMNKLTFEKETPVIGEEIMLWEAPGMVNKGDRIEQQFHNLKFGQASITKLDNNEELLCFWSCENEKYSIKSKVIRFD